MRLRLTIALARGLGLASTHLVKCFLLEQGVELSGTVAARHRDQVTNGAGR